jgi:hypothetical protein
MNSFSVYFCCEEGSAEEDSPAAERVPFPLLCFFCGLELSIALRFPFRASAIPPSSPSIGKSEDAESEDDELTESGRGGSERVKIVAPFGSSPALHVSDKLQYFYHDKSTAPFLTVYTANGTVVESLNQFQSVQKKTARR